MPGRERAFTLVDTLVAAAIAFTIGWATIALAHATVGNAARVGARVDGTSAVDRLSERMESDADSAWAVFVPSRDVSGVSNADGHEVDFAAQDALRRTSTWAYDWDAGVSTVTAYAYAPNAAPVAGETFSGIDAFSAELHPVTDLSNTDSDVYDPLFSGEAASAVDFDYGWSDAAALGGNHLVRVSLRAPGAQRVLVLSSATAPSHFTAIVTYTPAPTPPP